MPLRAAMPSTVRNPTSEPSEMIPPPAYAASTPPTRAEGSVTKDRVASRQLPNDDLQQQEDRQHGRHRVDQDPLLRGLPLGVLAQHLGVVLVRERDVVELVLDLRHHGAERAAAYVGVHVDAAEAVVVLDEVRGRLELDLRQFAQRHALARGRVDQQLLDAGHVPPRLRRAPDLDVVRLAVPEDVADLLPRDQGGRRAADVAGLEAVASGRRRGSP